MMPTKSKCEICKYLLKKRYPEGIRHHGKDYFYFCSKRKITIRKRIVNRACPQFKSIAHVYYVCFNCENKVILTDALAITNLEWNDNSFGYAGYVNYKIAMKLKEIFKDIDDLGYFEIHDIREDRNIDWNAYFD
jgi:hypothetical protein